MIVNRLRGFFYAYKNRNNRGVTNKVISLYWQIYNANIKIIVVSALEDEIIKLYKKY